MRRRLKFRKGFTFLEVLATLVILSVALTPILIWVPTSIQTKLRTERKTIAIFLAESKIEELRYKIINDFNTWRGTSSPQAFPNPYQDFSYTVSDDLNPSLKTISVKVWHTEKPEDETIFYTQISKR